MSATYSIANVQHSLMALKEKISPESWGETPLPVILAPNWWMADVAKELGAPDGSELAEIHGCAVIRKETVTEPLLLDHDGKIYPILPQWLRAKSTATSTD